jgi:hypothetical protein
MAQMTDKDKYEEIISEIEAWFAENEDVVNTVKTEYRIQNRLTNHAFHDAQQLAKMYKGVDYHGYKGSEAVMQAKADLRFFRAGLQNY